MTIDESIRDLSRMADDCDNSDEGMAAYFGLQAIVRRLELDAYVFWYAGRMRHYLATERACSPRS